MLPYAHVSILLNRYIETGHDWVKLTSRPNRMAIAVGAVLLPYNHETYTKIVHHEISKKICMFMTGVTFSHAPYFTTQNVQM